MDLLCVRLLEVLQKIIGCRNLQIIIAGYAINDYVKIQDDHLTVWTELISRNVCVIDKLRNCQATILGIYQISNNILGFLVRKENLHEKGRFRNAREWEYTILQYNTTLNDKLPPNFVNVMNTIVGKDSLKYDFVNCQNMIYYVNLETHWVSLFVECNLKNHVPFHILTSPSQNRTYLRSYDQHRIVSSNCAIYIISFHSDVRMLTIFEMNVPPTKGIDYLMCQKIGSKKIHGSFQLVTCVYLNLRIYCFTSSKILYILNLTSKEWTAVACNVQFNDDPVESYNQALCHPFEENTIYFPLWKCECEEPLFCCNSYNVETATWNSCPFLNNSTPSEKTSQKVRIFCLL